MTPNDRRARGPGRSYRVACSSVNDSPENYTYQRLIIELFPLPAF
jgi:hypothetical protein